MARDDTNGVFVTTLMVCYFSGAHMRVEHTRAGSRPAGTALSLTSYDSTGVYALKHTRMLVENTLAGPLPAVTVLPMTRDDTKGVYDLEHTHACGAHSRSVTPCCCGAVSGVL